VKKTFFLSVIGAAIAGAVLVSGFHTDPARAQPQLELRQSLELKFEEYRTAIRELYRIDIKNFKDKLPGGKADGKPITRYELKQLLSGINFERDHTADNMLALELAMDHLEVAPDYYTRLERMEWECRSEKLRDM
jgi:hypothetical protein